MSEGEAVVDKAWPNACNVTGDTTTLLDGVWTETKLIRLVENVDDVPYCSLFFKWHVRDEQERPLVGASCSLKQCCWESLGKLSPAPDVVNPATGLWHWQSCNATKP